MLVIDNHTIARCAPYRELGADNLERRWPVAAIDHLVHRLRQLGVAETVTSETGGAQPQADTALAATSRDGDLREGVRSVVGHPCRSPRTRGVGWRRGRHADRARQLAQETCEYCVITHNY